MTHSSIKNLLAAACLALLASAALAAGTDVRVENAWVREAPPGAEMLAGYMTVYNDGSAPVALTGASSPALGRIELHRTVMKNGVASMIAQKQVEIPAGAGVRFAPGGLHLMLFNPTRRLKEGQHIELSLRLDNGTRIDTQAEVRRTAGTPMEMDHQHMEPQSMGQ